MKASQHFEITGAISCLCLSCNSFDITLSAFSVFVCGGTSNESQRLPYSPIELVAMEVG